jgi:hypothetical protein
VFVIYFTVYIEDLSPVLDVDFLILFLIPVDLLVDLVRYDFVRLGERKLTSQIVGFPTEEFI